MPSLQKNYHNIETNNRYQNEYKQITKPVTRIRPRVKKSSTIKIIVKGVFIAFSMLLAGIILPAVFKDISSKLVLTRMENSYIEAPSDASFLHTAESLVANNNLLNDKNLGEINFKKPEMKQIQLSSEMSRLKSNLKNLAAQYPMLTTGVFIWDYSTGKYVDISSNDEFPTASIIKIPVLCQLFRRYDESLVDLSEKIPLTSYYRTDGSGDLQYKAENSKYSVDHLAQIMIQNSDNSATNMLMSNVGGMESMNRVLRDWGFNKTHLSNWLPDLMGTNVSTPKDLGTILYNIDNPEFLSLQSRARMVEIMSNVRNNRLIQAGLPPSAKFIHKTGDIGSMIGDAGIVTMPNDRKYIIVIMVKRPHNHYGAKEFVVKASEITYNAFAHGAF